ncbi:unnamed protein product [Ectocarpus fasciculatus]
MPGSELHDNSEWVRHTSRQCTLRTGVARFCPGLGVFQPVHSISRDETRTPCARGIHMPPGSAYGAPSPRGHAA